MNYEPYWLCCGSKLFMEHKSGCNEAKRGFKERCRFGTAEEHSQWSRKKELTSPRELSDKEILDICIMGSFYDRISDPFYDKKTGAWSLDEDLVQFARAILKKASEK